MTRSRAQLSADGLRALAECSNTTSLFHRAGHSTGRAIKDVG